MNHESAREIYCLSGVERTLKNRLAPLVQGSIGHSSNDKNRVVHSGVFQVVRVRG